MACSPTNRWRSCASSSRRDAKPLFLLRAFAEPGRTEAVVAALVAQNQVRHIAIGGGTAAYQEFLSGLKFGETQ